VLAAIAPSGLWLSGILYFFLVVRPPAHCHASTHFFSEISPLRSRKRHEAYLRPVGIVQPFPRGCLAPPPQCLPIRGVGWCRVGWRRVRWLERRGESDGEKDATSFFQLHGRLAQPSECQQQWEVDRYVIAMRRMPTRLSRLYISRWLRRC